MWALRPIRTRPFFDLKRGHIFAFSGPKSKILKKFRNFFFKFWKHPRGPSKWCKKFGSACIFWANKATLKKRPFWALERGTQLKRAISRPGRHVAQKFFCRASSSTHGVPPSHSDRSYGISDGAAILRTWIFLLVIDNLYRCSHIVLVERQLEISQNVVFLSPTMSI